MADDLSSRSLALTIVEASSLVILNVLSLIGNSLVCNLFYKTTRLRTTTNLYIIALAVSDLLSAIFVMPFGVGVLISSDWIFGETMCKIEAFFVCFVAYVYVLLPSFVLLPTLGIWHLRPRLSKRNWQDNQLLHCPGPITRVSFSGSHIQLHKSCKDDPTA